MTERENVTLEELAQRSSFYFNLNHASDILSSPKSKPEERAKARTVINQNCVGFDEEGDPSRELTDEEAGQYILVHKPAMAQFGLDYARLNIADLVKQLDSGKLEKAVLGFKPVKSDNEVHNGAYNIHDQLYGLVDIKRKHESGELKDGEYCGKIAGAIGKMVEAKLMRKNIKKEYIKAIVGTVTEYIGNSPLLAGRENEVLLSRKAQEFMEYFAEGKGAEAKYSIDEYARATLVGANIKEDSDESMRVVNNILACAPDKNK